MENIAQIKLFECYLPTWKSGRTRASECSKRDA